MNEIKLSISVSNKQARLAIKMDLKSLDLDWSKNDIIRVISKKKMEY